MKKPSIPTSDTVLVYVHGTNGSGKSTLARALLAASGGALAVEHMPDNPKASYTYTHEGVVFVGKYGNACGGVDGLSPYASINDIVGHHAPQGARMFAEGLITPGVETCRGLAAKADRHLFILLDTPVPQCIRNVLKRRAAKGNVKPYDPANLYRKHASAQSWANRIQQAGLSVQALQWIEAYRVCLDLLQLEAPSNP